MAEQFGQQQQWQAAAGIAEQLTSQLPRFGSGWLQRFGAANALADYPMLEHIADQCLARLPRFVPALVSKAAALRMQQRQLEALPYIDRAQALEPGNARVLNHLGIARKELGHFELALAAFNRCIAMDPLYADAYWNRADLYSQITDSDIDAMQKVLKHPKLTQSDRASLHYAIARGFEYRGNRSEQFAHVEAGAQAKRATISYDHAAEIEEIQRICAVFTRELLTNAAPPLAADHSSSPIFICGLPRSGTTLVEQILSSHPAVCAGEETPALPQATAAVLRHLSINDRFPEWCRLMQPAQWSQIGDNYRQLTKACQSTSFFTDKNLQNYKAIGLIRLVLPEAKIIFCQRNAMDIIWGCYRQLFTNGLAFTYSLEELADIYLAARKLLHHWQRLLGKQLHVVDYETLVNNQKQTTRELLDHIGLKWDDNCLHFHQNQRPVRTTSATQVRSPMHANRIHQWLPFEQQLQDLKLKLDPPA